MNKNKDYSQNESIKRFEKEKIIIKNNDINTSIKNFISSIENNYKNTKKKSKNKKMRLINI